MSFVRNLPKQHSIDADTTVAMGIQNDDTTALTSQIKTGHTHSLFQLLLFAGEEAEEGTRDRGLDIPAVDGHTQVLGQTCRLGAVVQLY